MAKKFLNGITIPTGTPSSGKVWTASDTAGNGSWQSVSGGGTGQLVINTAGFDATVRSDNLNGNRAYQLPDSAGVIALESYVDTAKNSTESYIDTYFALKLNPTALKTASYTAVENDFVPVDTTSGSVTITLPTAPSNGTRFGAKMVIQGGTNTVTITRGGTDVFNKVGGSTSVTLSLPLQSVQFQYSSGIWYGVAADIGLTALDARFQPLDSDLTAFAAKTAPTGAVIGTTDTQTLTNKTLTAPILGGTLTGTYTIGGTPTFPSTVIDTTTAQTLTNKRMTPRINSTTSSATPAINVDTTDQFNITALATAITSMTSGLAGTPTDGQKLLIRIKDNGTARAITWGTSFVSSGGATLLTTTVISKTHMVGFIYDSAAAKWVCQAVDTSGY